MVDVHVRGCPDELSHAHVRLPGQRGGGHSQVAGCKKLNTHVTLLFPPPCLLAPCGQLVRGLGALLGLGGATAHARAALGQTDRSAGAKPRRQEEEEEEEMSGPMSPSGGKSGVATVSMTHSAETQAFGSAARLCGEELAIRASQDVFITPAVPCAHVVARRGRWWGLPFGGTSVFFPPASSCPLRAARAGVGRPARVGRCNCACTCSFGPN